MMLTDRYAEALIAKCVCPVTLQKKKNLNLGNIVDEGGEGAETGSKYVKDTNTSARALTRASGVASGSRCSALRAIKSRACVHVGRRGIRNEREDKKNLSF